MRAPDEAGNIRHWRGGIPAWHAEGEAWFIDRNVMQKGDRLAVAFCPEFFRQKFKSQGFKCPKKADEVGYIE